MLVWLANPQIASEWPVCITFLERRDALKATSAQHLMLQQWAFPAGVKKNLVIAIWQESRWDLLILFFVFHLLQLCVFTRNHYICHFKHIQTTRMMMNQATNNNWCWNLNKWNKKKWVIVLSWPEDTALLIVFFNIFTLSFPKLIILFGFWNVFQKVLKSFQIWI